MHTLPDTLTIGHDGALYRTDNYTTPVRDNYARHHQTIDSIADLKASLRAGRFTSIGCYECFFFTSDGAALSYPAVVENFRAVVDSIRSRTNDGWRVVGLECAANCDGPIYCDHTGARLV